MCHALCDKKIIMEIIPALSSASSDFTKSALQPSSYKIDTARGLPMWVTHARSIMMPFSLLAPLKKTKKNPKHLLIYPVQSRKIDCATAYVLYISCVLCKDFTSERVLHLFICIDTNLAVGISPRYNFQCIPHCHPKEVLRHVIHVE